MFYMVWASNDDGGNQSSEIREAPKKIEKGKRLIEKSQTKLESSYSGEYAWILVEEKQVWKH